MSNNNLQSYSCYDEWDEWDEVDYGDSWDEYDNYSEYNEWDEWDEVDYPDHWEEYDNYSDNSSGGTGGGTSSKKQKILDLATSHFSVDKYIFTYIIYDEKKKTMIAATELEDHFALVNVSDFTKVNDEYYVESANSVSFTEVNRCVDTVRKANSSIADDDIYFSSKYNGIIMLHNGVRLYTYTNQVVCKNMSYAPLNAKSSCTYFKKVQTLIKNTTGTISSIDYNSSTNQTFVKSNSGKLYIVYVSNNAIFYNDERYVYDELDVDVQELCTVSDWIMSHYNVAKADIAVYSDRITFTDNGGYTYKILTNDLPDYIEYDYDQYIHANSQITAVLDYHTQSAIPSNYYRVIKQIQIMTGVEAEQDANGFIVFYGKSFYIPNAVIVNGWVYAERSTIISALKSNFLDIDTYLKDCGFYYGADDNGSNYTALTYKSQTTWLLGKVIKINQRFRVNDNQGKIYLNMTTDASNIETAVESVFGVTASYLGARALETKTLKSYIESKLYIRKSRVYTSGSSLYINDKPHTISSLQTSFNSNTYYDKTKLLSAVNALNPTISVSNVETILNNGENYAFIAGNKARISFKTSCLDHAAIGVSIGTVTNWFHNTSPTSSMTMDVDLHNGGSCTLIIRGRTTIDPADVGLSNIAHSHDCEVRRTITVMHEIPDDMVYIVPYARQQGCTVTENSTSVVVSYQHRFYTAPETCTYYRSLSGQQAYKRQVSYNNSGLYMNRETLRMDMDLDIDTDAHNVRDWYLEKRIWRLWHLGKVASFSSELTDSSGKKYHNVTMNGITRKIFNNPSDNKFYEPFVREKWRNFEYNNTSQPYNEWDEWDEVDYGDSWDEYDNYVEWDEVDSNSSLEQLTISRKAKASAPTGNNSTRNTIGIVNGHLVMPESAMFALYDTDVRVDEYIKSHYLIKDPANNIRNELNRVLLFGDDTNIDCISRNTTTSSNEEYINYSTVEQIKTSLSNYLSGYVNVYDSLDAKRKEWFKYTPSANNNEVGQVSFDGSTVDIPSLMLDISHGIPSSDEQVRQRLIAKREDVDRIKKFRRIIVYGAGFGGVCAAYKAAKYAWSLEGIDYFEIHLINPVPVEPTLQTIEINNKSVTTSVPMIGGIGTVGGQNFWDTRPVVLYKTGENGEILYDADNNPIIKERKYPYLGSLGEIMDKETPGIVKEDRYNTVEKIKQLYELLCPLGIHIKSNHDICSVEQNSDGSINSITIREIIRDENKENRKGEVIYKGSSEKIHGDIFIDASEDGKLTKITAHVTENGIVKPAYTRGRYDYPADTLNNPPQNNYGDFDEGEESGARMPAVTLMFKLSADTIQPVELKDKEYELYDIPEGSGKYACYNCGNGMFKGEPNSKYTNKQMEDDHLAPIENKLKQFNNSIKDTRIMIKPINSAWDGGEKTLDGSKYNWWLNSLLIFGVDGSLHNRDVHEDEYEIVPDDKLLSDEILNNENRLLSTDDAWRLGKVFLKREWNKHENGEPSLLDVYESLGYVNPKFVIKENNVETGDILYIRETIHAVKDVNNIANGTENSNYEVTMRHCHYAHLSDEQDSPSNPQSIGLIYYNSDIHPFKKSDYYDGDNYISGYDSYRKIRFDMGSEELKDGSPKEAAFIPYSALTTKYVPNMLIPGYAVNASSFAWSEMRVFPNLCVLGDAAGIAAVTCLLSGESAYDLTDITGVRTILKSYNTILDRGEIYK